MSRMNRTVFSFGFARLGWLLLVTVVLAAPIAQGGGIDAFAAQDRTDPASLLSTPMLLIAAGRPISLKR